MAIFQYYAQAVLKRARNLATLTPPATTYHRPYVSEGNQTGLGTFTLSSAFPTALAVANNSSIWGAPSGRDLSNLVEIDFGLAAATETLAGAVELDGSGNPLNWYRFSTPRSVTPGQPLKLPAAGVDHGMRDSIFTYYAQVVLEFLHNLAAWTPPATTYWQLVTALGTAINDSGFTPSAQFPTRLAITNNSTTWGTPSAMLLQNIVDFNWGNSPGGPETIVGVVEYDAATSGNPLGWAPLDLARTVNTGDPMIIAAGAFTHQFVEEFI